MPVVVSLVLALPRTGSRRQFAPPDAVPACTGTAGCIVPDRQLLILLVLTPPVAWGIGRLFHRRIGELEWRET